MQHEKTIIIRKPYENDAISDSKLEHDDLLAQNDTLYETKKYMEKWLWVNIEYHKTKICGPSQNM